MMKNLIASLLCLSVSTVGLLADIGADIKSVVEANFEATEAENLVGVLDTMHPESAAFGQTEALLKQLFPVYELDYEILSYEFVSVSGEYAIVRVKQHTQKVEGPEFMNNTADTLQVFKQHAGSWKLWSQAILEVTFD